MKTLPTGLQDHLDSGSSTMCYCWKVTRQDGVVMGFTEHDVDLTIDGLVYEAEAGFTPTQAQQSLGMAVDNVELVSAFSSTNITEDDLTAGVYDDAFVEVFWVNWQDTTQIITTISGNLGEVTQSGIQFSSELRSLTHRLNQRVGRVYQRTCDAVLGDGRCRVNLANFTDAATISRVIAPNLFEITGPSQEGDYYSRGVVKFTSGTNLDLDFDIREHTVIAGVQRINLWNAPLKPVSVGDTVTVSAGCLQTTEICRNKFSNLANFQGFPHMPGKDIVTDYPTRGDENNTGGQLVF